MTETYLDPPTPTAANTKPDMGKPRMSLLPYKVLGHVADVFAAGLGKDGRRPDDWKAAVRAPGGRGRYVDALLRHAGHVADGHALDDGPGGTGELHVALVVTNGLILLWDAVTPNA